MSLKKAITTLSLLALPSLGFTVCNGNWITNGSGDWSNAGNWDCEPIAPGDTATFGSFPSSAIAIFVDSGFNISGINFNSSTTSYTLEGIGNVTLFNPSPSISVIGEHFITTGLFLEHVNVSVNMNGSTNNILHFTNTNFTDSNSILPHSNITITGGGQIIGQNTQPVLGSSAGNQILAQGIFSMTGGIILTENRGLVKTTSFNAGNAFNAGSSFDLTSVNLTNNNTGNVGSYDFTNINLGSFMGTSDPGSAVNLVDCQTINTNTGLIRNGYGTILESFASSINITGGTFTARNNAPQIAPANFGGRIGGCAVGICSGSSLTINGAIVSFINNGNIAGGSGTGGIYGCIADINTLTIQNSGGMNCSNNAILAQPAGAITNIASGVKASNAININSGYFTTNDVLTTPTLTTQAQGILSGTGTLYGVPMSVNPIEVTNNGAVIPGFDASGTPAAGVTSPGTLTINGNYTQSANGDLIINIQNDFNFSKLQIDGTALLDGKVFVAIVPDSSISLLDSYNILHADGGFGSSRFDAVIGLNLPAGFTPVLHYQANDVYLSFLDNN